MISNDTQSEEIKKMYNDRPNIIAFECLINESK